MGAPLPPRSRLRLRAAATNIAYFLAVAFLAQTILNSLRGRMPSSSSGSWTSTQTLSDAEIDEVCQRYAVPEPPPFRPEKAALAAELVQQLATGGGIYAFTGNKTFTGLMATLTLEERERIAMEASTVVYHTFEEATQQLQLEAVRLLGLPGWLQQSTWASGLAGACWHHRTVLKSLLLAVWLFIPCRPAERQPPPSPVPQEAILKAAPHSDLTILNGEPISMPSAAPLCL